MANPAVFIYSSALGATNPCLPKFEITTRSLTNSNQYSCVVLKIGLTIESDAWWRITPVIDTPQCEVPLSEGKLRKDIAA